MTNPLRAVGCIRFVRPDWWSFRHSKDPDSFPIFLLPWISFRPRRLVSLSPTNGESAHLSFGIGRHYWTLACHRGLPLNQATPPERNPTCTSQRKARHAQCRLASSSNVNWMREAGRKTTSRRSWAAPPRPSAKSSPARSRSRRRPLSNWAKPSAWTPPSGPRCNQTTRLDEHKALRRADQQPETTDMAVFAIREPNTKHTDSR